MDNDDDNVCTNCNDKLDNLAVFCLECEDVRMCLACFSHGAQIGPHKNSDAYKLHCQKPPGQYLITNDGWTGDDILQVLDFVEQYSFGCWDELPKNALNRSLSDIKSHFTKYFMDGTIGALTWGKVNKPQLEDYTANYETTETNINLSGLSKIQYAELGYNSIRDEFELENEFDNNAEAVLNTASEWNDLGEDYNLACIDIYYSRLQERYCAKEMVNDYQLMDKYFFAKEKPKRRLTVDEKYLQSFESQMKKYTRYALEMELWSFNTRLQHEYVLKKRRDELTYYRKNGLTKIFEIVMFNLLHSSLVPDEQSELSPSDNLAPAPMVNRGEKRKKKRKRPKLFHKKNHVYHRTPQYIAALNRVLTQNNDSENDSD